MKLEKHARTKKNPVSVKLVCSVSYVIFIFFFFFFLLLFLFHLYNCGCIKTGGKCSDGLLDLVSAA